MRKRWNKNKAKYIKVPKDLFKQMHDLLWNAENHADYDFDYERTDEYLKKVKDVCLKAEAILFNRSDI